MKLDKNEHLKLPILYFLCSWLLCAVTLLLMPVEAKTDNRQMILLLNITFVTLVTVTSLVSYLVVSAFQRDVVIQNPGRNAMIQIKKIRYIIRTSSIFSSVGLVSILYDRIIIRGIDFSQGLRSARYQWINSSREGMGGSIFSVGGNILVPFAYIAIMMTFLHWENLKVRYRILGSLAGLLVPFAHAAINGGRSNVFILIVLLICTTILRKSAKLPIIPRMNMKYLKIAGLIILSILFAVQIFASSVQMANLDSYQYMKNLVGTLKGELQENRYSFSDSSYLGNQIIMIGTYLYHGQWVAQDALDLYEKPGDYILTPYMYLLNLSGIFKNQPEPTAFGDVGAFISLPGAIVYDFGYLGLIVSSVLLGIMLGLVMVFLKSNHVKTGFHLAFILFVLIVLVLSPVLFASGFVYFNFMIISFLCMEVLTRIRFGRSCWVRVTE